MRSLNHFVLYLIYLVFNQKFLYSNDILLDYYRKYGDYHLNKYADKLLVSHKYWLNRLENYDTSFGYYENIKNLIIVDKSFHSLDLYKYKKVKNYKFDFVFQYQLTADILIGKNPGTKQKEGDKKTPTGVYKLTKRLYKLRPFYGPLALVLNYPNLLDNYYSRTGSGIWIHGKPLNGTKRKKYTQGCVAIDNYKLKKLDKLIPNLNQTLVIISNYKLPKVSKSDLAYILVNLYKWKDSWQNNNLIQYLSYYSKEFKKTNHKDFQWLIKYKKRIFNLKRKQKIYITDINIVPYPNSQNRKLFYISFYEIFSSSTYNWQGNKELIIELDNKQMKIIIEN